MSDGGLCLAPEKRTLLRLCGPDAVRFLNGQISQEVRGLDEVRAVPACVTDAKGKLQHYVHVFRAGEDLLIEAPYDQREELCARLDRYLISDDAEIIDESDAWEMVHVIGGEASGAMVRGAHRIAPGGHDVWNPVGASPALPLLSEEQAEDWRIAARIPAWGKELTAGMLPPEAGLDRTAISYRKGCYIGQEVLSRMKTAGKLNRKLMAFSVPEGTASGDRIGQGVITSVSAVADRETGRYPALGFLHKSDFERTEVEISGADGSAKGAGLVVA